MDDERVLRLLDGELTENDAERSRQHLRGCGACAARVESFERALRDLKAPLPEVDPKMAVDDLMRLLPAAVHEPRTPEAARKPRARIERIGLVSAGIAALVAAAFLVVPRGVKAPEADPEGIQARGAPLGASLARGVGVSVHRAGAVLAPEARVTGHDAYGVRYRNLLEQPAYLLAFAVDAKGAVHWICPAYIDPKSNPAAVALPHSTSEVGVGSAMQLDAPAVGPMRFVSILTTSPLHVLDVDVLHAGDLETASLRARWPAADVRDLATVYVDSAP